MTKKRKHFILGLFNFILILGISFNAQSQTVQVVSNNQGYVSYESTFLPSNLHFYLTGDGFYKREINPSHQFEYSADGYDSEYYTIGNKELDEPTARVVRTGGTFTPPSGGNNNPPIPMSPNIDLETSWNITNYAHSFAMLKFENEFQSLPSSGCIEFIYNPDELIVDVSEIKLQTDWATIQNVSSNKITFSYTNLENGKQRVLYIPVIAIVENNTPITMEAKLFNNCSGAPLAANFSVPVAAFPHDPNYKKSIKLQNLSNSDALENHHGTTFQTIVYEVQFHNDGAGIVKNVHVEDIMPQGMDASSIEILYSEADVQVSGSDFYFNNINLPGLAMGYSLPETTSKFAFKVCLKRYITYDDCITNEIKIHFDNQLPISAENTLCCYNEYEFDNPCSTISPQEKRISPEQLENENVNIAPNPANDYIELFNIDVNSIKSLKIVGTDGKMLALSPNSRIDISKLTKGIYFIHIKTNESNSIKKFVKM